MQPATAQEPALERSSEFVLFGGRRRRVEFEGELRRVWNLDGTLYAEGRLVDGRRQGVHRSFHANGAQSTTQTWIDGLREGESLHTADNGLVLVRGQYRAGYKHGTWERWYADGTRQSIESWHSDGASQLRHGLCQVWQLGGELDLDRSGTYEWGERVLDAHGYPLERD